jgi:RNA polymerase sigma-70 factor (ECF subfamily)
MTGFGPTDSARPRHGTAVGLGFGGPFRCGPSPVILMESFETAYRQHFAAVFRFAVSLVGRRDVAEDLTADAFLELHRHMDRIQLDQLPAWLFVVVRNRARDRWRRLQTEQRSARWLAQDAVGPSAPASPQWLLSEGLSSVQRVCLELHYVWGFTVAEAAGRLGMTEGQVKGHLQRALVHLRTVVKGTAQ